MFLKRLIDFQCITSTRFEKLAGLGPAILLSLATWQRRFVLWWHIIECRLAEGLCFRFNTELNSIRFHI